MSLTKQDLKDIKGIVKETVSTKIDSFTVIVAKGFDEIHDKLREHDQRFEIIDQRFEKNESQLSYLKQKMDQNHRELIDKIDHLGRRDSEDIQAIGVDVANLDKRVTKLERAKA